MKDKREIIRARKAFRRSLKDEKKFLKQGKKEVRKQKKDSAVLDENAWKKEIKEKLEEMREASKERVKQANEDYNHILQNSPPSLFSMLFHPVQRNLFSVSSLPSFLVSRISSHLLDFF